MCNQNLISIHRFGKCTNPTFACTSLCVYQNRKLHKDQPAIFRSRYEQEITSPSDPPYLHPTLRKTVNPQIKPRYPGFRNALAKRIEVSKLPSQSISERACAVEKEFSNSKTAVSQILSSSLPPPSPSPSFHTFVTASVQLPFTHRFDGFISPAPYTLSNSSATPGLPAAISLSIHFLPLSAFA